MPPPRANVKRVENSFLTISFFDDEGLEVGARNGFSFIDIPISYRRMRRVG